MTLRLQLRSELKSEISKQFVDQSYKGKDYRTFWPLTRNTRVKRVKTNWHDWLRNRQKKSSNKIWFRTNFRRLRYIYMPNINYKGLCSCFVTMQIVIALVKKNYRWRELVQYIDRSHINIYTKQTKCLTQYSLTSSNITRLRCHTIHRSYIMQKVMGGNPKSNAEKWSPNRGRKTLENSGRVLNRRQSPIKKNVHFAAYLKLIVWINILTVWEHVQLPTKTDIKYLMCENFTELKLGRVFASLYLPEVKAIWGVN